MKSKLKSLLHNLIVLAGLMLSTNLFACAPDDSSSEQIDSQLEYSQLGSFYFAKKPETLKENRDAHHSHEKTDSDSHHECDCCEFCRCTSCTDCAVCASATVSVSISSQLVRLGDGRISPLNNIYISQTPNQLYHPPILTLFYLA